MDTNERSTDVAIGHEHRVRVTLVPNGWPSVPCVRIGMFNAKNQYLRGPEIPLDKIGDIMQAIINLQAEPPVGTPAENQ